VDGPRLGRFGALRALLAPITKSSDRFADFTLRIKRRKCGHERMTLPHFL